MAAITYNTAPLSDDAPKLTVDDFNPWAPNRRRHEVVIDHALAEEMLREAQAAQQPTDPDSEPTDGTGQ